MSATKRSRPQEARAAGIRSGLLSIQQASRMTVAANVASLAKSGRHANRT
jgi:hypothetical protein